MRRTWAGVLAAVVAMTGLSSNVSAQQSSDGQWDKDSAAIVVVLRAEGRRAATLTDGDGRVLKPLVPPDSSGMNVYLIRGGDYQVTFNGADPILFRAKPGMGNLILVDERRTQNVNMRSSAIPLPPGGGAPMVAEPAENMLNLVVR
jgi:hypothetical protein